jgi:hypothetical protein
MGNASSSGSSRKRQRAKKPPAQNWFERLKGAELQRLLRAAKLPVSGSKNALVERCLASDVLKEFGVEARGRGASGQHVYLEQPGSLAG